MVTPFHLSETHARERVIPAWSVSILFHVVFVVLFALLFRAIPRGAVEEPGRTVGIVLQNISDEGERFEGEEDQPEEAIDEAIDGDNASSADLLDALPDEEAVAAAEAALPNLPTLGPGGLETGGVGDAGEMTRGGGGRPGGLSGGKAHVRVFGAEGVGTKFIYVFDRSISMQGRRLAAAKQELIKSLESLESTHQFHIIFFNHDIRVWDLTGGQNRIAFGTDRNKEFAARWVSSVTADGGTDRLAALQKAIAFRPDVIFFLTDEDWAMSAAELRRIKIRNGGRTAISSIEFGAGPPHGRRNFLVELAGMTGGQYVYVNTRRLGQ